MPTEQTQTNNNPSRSDFLKKEITSWNSFITEETILKSKFNEMKESSYHFFRATAHLFYKDIDSLLIPIPSEWKQTPRIKTWIQGDLHTQNLGFFENADGQIKLDVNDFDESFIAPFYLDLIRFVTSIFLQREDVDFKFSPKEASDLAEYFLEEYQETLSEISEDGKELELIENNLDGFPKDTVDELKDKKSNITLLAKWTKSVDGKVCFDLSNPELRALSDIESQEIRSNWNNYLESLGDFSSEKGDSFFQIQDIARRLHSGMGSQGVYKYYVLIQGDSNPLLLEVKEQRLPCLFLMKDMSEAEYNSFFTNHAERTKTACNAMLANPDSFLGTMITTNRSYLVSRISPFKKKLESKDFHSESDFKKYLKHSARAVAYAHSRSYKSILIRSTSLSFANTALSAIKAWSGTRNTIVKLGNDYAEQVKSDFALCKSWL
ncbi:MAG TPA: DUF2252 family protein [Leptospiraceae bacterium]|nr:DUF2252 family protein [Leptospiraceae bacterium]HRG75679.1 DUF2252 family protein [Leptospiraceae bacterium]